VVLTFDDGLLNHYTYAFPLLKELGFPACFFVIANFIGREGFMDWEHLEALRASGMEVGSHGLSHNLLSLMPDEEIEKEFLFSKDILEKNLNRPVEFLSIPRGHDNLKIRKLAQGLGYKAICASMPGYINKASSPISLNRFFLRSNTTLSDFADIMRGELLIKLKIKIQSTSFLLLRHLLGMGLYEKIRMRLLKDEYAH
jgi:peptidoglycan/xylan/chitin deacetylase (PgdA/CDA1 family)